MWQTGRQLICIECGKVRFEIATDAARKAIEDYERALRLEHALEDAVAAHEAPQLAPALSALAKGLFEPPGPPQPL